MNVCNVYGADKHRGSKLIHAALQQFKICGLKRAFSHEESKESDSSIIFHFRVVREQNASTLLRAFNLNMCWMTSCPNRFRVTIMKCGGWITN